MTAALESKMEDIEDHQITERGFYFLRDFLQPDSVSTLESTAQSLLNLLPEKNLMESNERTIFNNVCIEFAEQIPCRHPSQHKFAALIEILSGSTRLNVSNSTSGGGYRINWMGGELREAWAGMR